MVWAKKVQFNDLINRPTIISHQETPPNEEDDDERIEVLEFFLQF